MKNEDTMFVYCNDKMLELPEFESFASLHSMSEKIRPVSYSDALVTPHRVLYTAEYRISDLEKIPQELLDNRHAFWVEIGSYDKTQEHWNDYVITRHYNHRKMLQEGLLDYIWDNYGIGSPKGIAHAIFNICVLQGVTPISLFNSIEKWNRRKKK